MKSRRVEVLACLVRVIEGYTDALTDLSEFGNASVFDAWFEDRPTLLVRREAVAGVLRGMLDGSVSSLQARDWAFLIRNGLLGSWGEEPPRIAVQAPRLPIEWEPRFEDQINEATARLDEIGDAIDGEIAEDEALELLRVLRS